MHGSHLALYGKFKEGRCQLMLAERTFGASSWGKLLSDSNRGTSRGQTNGILGPRAGSRRWAPTSGPKCTEKPGCLQATGLATSTFQIALFSTSLASTRSIPSTHGPGVGRFSLPAACTQRGILPERMDPGSAEGQ